MNVRIDINTSLKASNEDTISLPEQAQQVATDFAAKCEKLGVCPLRYYALHEATSKALFFILAAFRDSAYATVKAKELVPLKTKQRASRLFNKWHKPVLNQQQVQTWIADHEDLTKEQREQGIEPKKIAALWVALNPAHRREYMNDWLCLPEVFKWFEERPKRRDACIRFARDLAENWDKNKQAWDNAVELVEGLPL